MPLPECSPRNAKNIPMPAIWCLHHPCRKDLEDHEPNGKPGHDNEDHTFNGDCNHYLLDRVTLTLEANNGVGKVCIHTHAWPEAKWQVRPDCHDEGGDNLEKESGVPTTS